MRLKSLTVAAVAGVALSLAVAPPASAATLSVTTTADTVDSSIGNGVCADADGNCSLRAAIQEANASPGADSIRLALEGSYTLAATGAGEDDAATGDLDVWSGITLLGRGSVLDAAGLDRAFDVRSGSLDVFELTVVGGAPPATESGGAFRSVATLSIQDSHLEGNTVVGDGASGGAVFNDHGTLTIEDSTLYLNTAARAGGGVEANEGTTTLRAVYANENAAGPSPGNGGGLHLTGAGIVTIVGSNFTSNDADAEGGGVWNSSTGSMSIDDTGFYYNTVQGAEADQGGGGLFNDGGTLSLTDSSVYDNVASGASGSGGGLLNNLGTVDIRHTTFLGNVARRAGGGIEANVGTTTLVDVALDLNTAEENPGNGGGLHLTGAGTVSITGGEVVSNRAAAEGGGLWNSSTGTFSVTGTEISENTASGDDPDQGGGGLFNDGGTLTVEDSTVTANVADGTSGSGGGILNNLGTLQVTGSDVLGNTAQRAGGGIEANVGATRLLRVDLSSNATGANPGNGGGLHLTGAGTVMVDGSTVRDNTASAEGGGLWNSAVGTMEVRYSSIRGNAAGGADADQGGGGLFNDGDKLTVRNSQVRENAADGTAGSGGGILNNLGTLRVVGVYVSDNSATRAGGGIEANGGRTIMLNVSLVDNVTGAGPGNGGGLHLTGAGRVTIDDGRVVTNSATSEGGGLWNSATGTMVVNGTDIFRNDAPVGRNVFNDGGTFTIDGVPVPVGP